MARIELDSPRNRNALSGALLQQLDARVAEAVSDAAVRVLLLSHAGPSFCSGADLREQAASLHRGVPGPGVGALAPLFRRLLDAPKPVVCRVGGPARAGGVGLVAACDLALAAESADFATGEVRLGLAPAVLAVVALPKLGRAAAARLFLTGAAISAREAERIGLVSRTLPDPELDGAVEETVAQLLEGEPGALAAAKRVLQTVPGLPRERALEEMAELSRQLFSSPAAQEGISAFLEHRRPSWGHG